MLITYLDFDLLIERAGDRYRARILGSPAGEASVEFNVPFSQSEIDDFFIQIGQSRSFETEQTRRIHGFGQALFEAVFQGALRDRLRASMEEGTRHCDGLRIRLRLADTPELGNLPWEFLYDPGLNRFLALSVESPLVRYLETPKTAQPFAVQPPLRILAMICGPKDFPRLDTEREWEHLQESLAGLQARGLVDLQRMMPPTLSALQQQLRREQYHIFHFIGHGTFSTRDQDGYLLFEDAQHAGKRISGRDLGTILHDHRPLRLAVLNACEGARTSMDDQFAGTAQSLMQQGIPAVIAMQFRITDQASITLAREFYGSLADGYPVDAALTEARKAIKTEGNDLEWGTPVLYMRSPDGHIFDVVQMPGMPRAPAPSGESLDSEQAARLGKLYTEGLESFYLGQWEAAYQKFQAITDLSSGYRDAGVKLETARQKLRVQSLEEQASLAEKAGNWEKASEALNELAAVDPAFPDLAARMAQARRRAQLSDLYAEARELAPAQKWEAILGIFAEMDKIEPRYPDPDGLRVRAEQSLAKMKREAQLETLYETALQALDAQDWRTAAAQLRRVRQMQAGYRETDALLRRAEVELSRLREVKSAVKPAVPVDSSKGFESLLLWMFVIPAVAKFLAESVGQLIFPTIQAHLPDTIAFVAFSIPGGLFGGLALWWFLHRAVGKLSASAVLMLLAVSTLAQSLIIGIGVFARAPLWGWTLLWAAFGALIGIPIALISLAKAGAARPRTGGFIILGWLAGYAIGTLAANAAGDILARIFNSQIGLSMLEQSIGVFFGSWVTVSQFQPGAERHINRNTVLAGAAGLGLGNLVTNLVFSSASDQWIPLQLGLWGLIGGSALAFPSRNVRRYLLLGILGGVALSLGSILSARFPDLGAWRFGGALFGLALGLLTKRFSKALVMLVAGFSAFMLRGSIWIIYTSILPQSRWPDLIVFALGAGISGAILATAWSYFSTDQAGFPTKQPA